jgi:hypothetical protein
MVYQPPSQNEVYCSQPGWVGRASGDSVRKTNGVDVLMRWTITFQVRWRPAATSSRRRGASPRAAPGRWAWVRDGRRPGLMWTCPLRSSGRRPPLVTDLDGGEVEGVEDQLDVVPDQGGVGFQAQDVRDIRRHLGQIRDHRARRGGFRGRGDHCSRSSERGCSCYRSSFLPTTRKSRSRTSL